MSAHRYALVVPTLNPDSVIWRRWLDAVARQTARPAYRLVLDSGSPAETQDAAQHDGFEVVPVERGNFDHGGTRQRGVDLVSERADLVVMLTQDALLADERACERLLEPFADRQVAFAYGRQLPHADASHIARHAREFNYPPQSQAKTYDSRHTLGLKAAFCSDSFAAYRIAALRAVGGFASPVVFGEDMHLAARLLQAGWRGAYCAEACVYHSHNYSLREELARYFDAGAFHADNPWLLRDFGNAHGEGRRFVMSELRFLLGKAPLSIPRALANTAGKLLGYKLGHRYRALPPAWRVRLGMNGGYWKRHKV